MSVKHQRALEIFEIMFENNLLTAYAGPFDNEILTILAENLEETLWENESIRRRFFKIFIELAQNIALHSEERIIFTDKKIIEEQDGSKIIIEKEKNLGEGIFLISDYEDYFVFIAGNVVGEKVIDKLKKRAEAINNLNRDELRALKRDLRAEATDSGGGNIGMVQVALLSKNPIEIYFLETEETNKFFYLVSVKMEKDEKWKN